MIETSFKNSQTQHFKLYKNKDVLLLGYAPLLGIKQYVMVEKHKILPGWGCWYIQLDEDHSQLWCSMQILQVLPDKQ